MMELSCSFMFLLFVAGTQHVAINHTERIVILMVHTSAK